MSAEPYNDAVRQRFENPLHAGDLGARYPDVVTVEACESEAGCRIVLAAAMDGNIVRRLRYRVFGCPHLIAAAEELCGRLEGQGPQALQDVPLAQLMQLLEVPVEKTGRLLLLEDAAHLLAQAILDREQCSTDDNRRN
jgi:NifU-like protein involved in Fe-S cluster formation